MAQAQGAQALTSLQMERSFKTAATSVKSKKVYFIDNSLGRSQTSETSKVKRGASRQPTRGIAGTVDVGGSISGEIMATSAFWAAVLGSVQITGATVTVGSALSAPTVSSVDWVNQQAVFAQTSHGLVIGDTVEIIATAPSIMNGTYYYPVIDVPTSGTFVVWVPMGGSSTITLTSIKPCTAGTFTYTYKGGGKLPSYIIEKGFPDIAQYFKYTGCTAGSLDISNIAASGIASFNVDFMGAAETTATSSFDSGTPIDNTKISFDNTLLAAADVKEGGSAINYLKSISIKLDNALDGDTFVVGGGGVRGGINAGVYQVTGSIQAVFQDMALYTKALNRTESSLDLAWKLGTGAGTAGNESVQIVIPELLFSAKSPPVSSDGGVFMDMDFTGDYTNNADAAAIKVIVKCTQLPGQVI
jgi:hypothetical protein